MKSLLNLIFFIILVFKTSDAFSKTHLLKIAKNRAFDIIDKAKIGKDECSTNLKSLITDMFNFKKSWALKMIDASAKPQTGLLTGNIHQIGNYDECLAIHEYRGKYGTIEGQYCTVTLMPSINFTSEYSHLLNMLNFSEWITGLSMEDQHIVGILKHQKSTIGICLPKACSTENLQVVWDHIERTFKIPAHIDFSETMCTYKGKSTWPFPFDNYIFMAFGLVAIILLLSTMYDLLVHQYLENKSEINIWTSFSMYSNLKKIFNVDISEDRDAFLDCTAGLKTICMLAVIYGHKFCFMVLMGNINNTDLFEWRTQFRNAFQLSIHYSVDTFLMLSGMFLSYTYIKSRDTVPKLNRFPLFHFYFYRFLRLWPGLIALILFYVGVLKHLNDGPFWPAAMYKTAPICRATGWATALFITNFVSFPFQCIEQSWYLAVDTQLYIISPIVLINLYKHPKTTSFICTLLCTLSAIYAFVITYKHHYGHNVFESDRDYHDYIYQPTYLRMPAWFIGIFLGYFLYYYRQIQIPKGLNVFIWLLTSATMFGLIFIHTVIARKGYNSFNAGLYNACARPLWALGSGAIVFLCATGHAEALNKFLSQKVFKIVTRISYSVYLIHIGFQAYITCSKRTFTHYNNFHCFHQFFADLFFIFCIAVLWCLAFEAPFVNIAKLCIKQEASRVETEKLMRRQKRRKNKKDIDTVLAVYKAKESKKLK